MRSAPRAPRRRPDDHAAPVRLGRRRAGRRTPGRPIRHGPGRRAGHAARALGPARRPRDGRDRGGAAPRAPGDRDPVRRRHAGRRDEPGRAGSPQRHARPRHRGDLDARRRQCPRVRRGREVGREGTGPEAAGRRRQGRRRRGRARRWRHVQRRLVPGSRPRRAIAACRWRPGRPARSPTGWAAGSPRATSSAAT